MKNSEKKLCDVFDDRIWLFLSGELEQEEIRQWQLHVQECAQCRQRKEDIDKTLQLYDRLGEEQVDEAFFQQAVDQAVGAHRARIRPLRKKIARTSLLGTLAAAAIITLIYFGVTRMGPNASELDWQAEYIDTELSELETDIELLSEDFTGALLVDGNEAQKDFDDWLEAIDSGILEVRSELEQN